MIRVSLGHFDQHYANACIYAAVEPSTSRQGRCTDRDAARIGACPPALCEDAIPEEAGVVGDGSGVAGHEQARVRPFITTSTSARRAAWAQQQESRHHFGLRFSRNAASPSRAAAVSMTLHIVSTWFSIFRR